MTTDGPIVEFLLARIAVDEDGLARTHRDLAEALRIQGMGTTADWLMEQCSRVLAECEAKRRIVEEHTYAPKPIFDKTCVDEADDLILANDCPTLRALAAVYSDHPDYREEWKP